MTDSSAGTLGICLLENQSKKGPDLSDVPKCLKLGLLERRNIGFGHFLINCTALMRLYSNLVFADCCLR